MTCQTTKVGMYIIQMYIVNNQCIYIFYMHGDDLLLITTPLTPHKVDSSGYSDDDNQHDTTRGSRHANIFIVSVSSTVSFANNRRWVCNISGATTMVDLQ